MRIMLGLAAAGLMIPAMAVAQEPAPQPDAAINQPMTATPQPEPAPAPAADPVAPAPADPTTATPSGEVVDQAPMTDTAAAVPDENKSKADKKKKRDMPR